MKSATDDTMDFTRMRDMAARDPQAFEALRAEMVRELIENSPEDVRKRLRGLQWRLDRMRERSGSPMGACLRMYSMMWDSLLGDEGLFKRMEQAALGQTDSDHEPPPEAEVLDFPRHKKN